MISTLTVVLVVSGLVLGIFVMLELGRQIGLRLVRPGATLGTGVGAVEGAVFGLMGLLLAFTFSGASARFDTRRDQIVEEANDIGTAYLRLDLLAPEPRAALQEKFRQYLDARLAAYRAIPDTVSVHAELMKAASLQGEIWAQAVKAAGEVPGPQASTLLLPALNEMFDIASTRTAAAEMHPPPVIGFMLIVLTLACALLAGFDMASTTGRNWVHMLSFAVTLAVALYVIADLEFPRLGFIRIDKFDRLLVEVRAQMR
jgi:hypothetical protein